MKTTTVGIDLAKNAFQIHAVDERDKTALKKQLKRDHPDSAASRDSLAGAIH